MLENPRISASSKILLHDQFLLKSLFSPLSDAYFEFQDVVLILLLKVPSGWLTYYLCLQAINQVYIMKWLASVPIKFIY